MWSMRPCSSSRAIACTARLSRMRRPRPGDAGEVDRCAGVHERQRHELGEAAGLVLDPLQHAQVRRPSGAGRSTWPYIIVELDRIPSRCAVVTTSIHWLVGSLPLVRTQRTSSSRISAAVPGIVSSPASLAFEQPVADRQPGAGGAVDDLHRAERVHVHLRHPLLHRGREVEVRRAGQLGVDAALHADLGRAEVPGLLGPVGDLVERQRVGVGVGAALGERAEPAAGVADVGEVDVPVDDVGDVVADDVPAAASSASAHRAS